MNELNILKMDNKKGISYEIPLGGAEEIRTPVQTQSP